MTAEYPRGDEPLIPMPALSLPALRQAVATVAPSRLPEFFQEIQDAFTQAGDEDSVFPHPPLLPALGRRHRHRATALGRRPAPRRRTSPRRSRPGCPGFGSSGSRRDRPGGLPRGRGWLSGTRNPRCVWGYSNRRRTSKHFSRTYHFLAEGLPAKPLWLVTKPARGPDTG
jgi:hypothetical protein